MVPTMDSHSRTVDSMSRPSVSIAIDSCSVHCVPFDRLGSHPAFRKPYMPKLFTFLKESDSESIRRSHRRRAKEIAVSMSKKASVNKNVATKTMLSRPAAQRTVVSKITGRDAGRCNRLRCPLARMSGLQCFNMGHNGHGINLYGVSMTLMVN